MQHGIDVLTILLRRKIRLRAGEQIEENSPHSACTKPRTAPLPAVLGWGDAALYQTAPASLLLIRGPKGAQHHVGMGFPWVLMPTTATARVNLDLPPPGPLPRLATAAPPERGQVGLLLLLHALQGWGAAVSAAGAAGTGQAAVPTAGPCCSLLHLHQQLGRQAAQRGHR